MHDIKWIRDNPDAFDAGLALRGLPPLAADLIARDEARRTVISTLQVLLERRNSASKEIGAAKATKDEARAAALMGEVAALKTQIPALEAQERELGEKLEAQLAAIPNLPNEDVPVGADEHANVERYRVGEKPVFAYPPLQHFDIGERLGLMDFETAAKLSGARFVVLKGKMARLERAIANFMLDQHTGEFGYTEVNPPVLVKDHAMFGTAQLPKFFDDQFATYAGPIDVLKDNQAFINIKKCIFDEIDKNGIDIVRNMDLEFDGIAKDADRYWLIPTAEVPLTNLVRESILSEDELPLRYTAWTPCFRAEAGSAGRDTRGMIRQHQFSKVEMVSITTPEQSSDEHERMLSAAENILKKLKLHYRVMTLCTGDMGFASKKTYDIEVWLPGQDAFREISSCSVCGDFQARRMNARVRAKDSKTIRHVHTLNGSGLAVGRTLVAILENYQQGNGSVVIPDVLVPYMGGRTCIEM